MMRKLSLLIAALAVLAVTPTGAGAYLPPGFIGVAPQSPPNGKDYRLMQKSGVRVARLPLNWSAIESDNPEYFLPDWSGFDHEVELAAEARIRVMPFIYNSPEWVAGHWNDLPVRTAWQRRGWTRFLRAAVQRYGPEGQFWEEHPDLPFVPFHRWEIWNEQNIVTFSRQPDPVQYAKLIRISGRALHGADPNSDVLLGGLFGRPLQIPPNIASGDFLNRIYRSGNVKPYFDGVALHPYVADAKAMRWQLRNLRRIMRKHHDARTRLYVTELGWGSRSGPTRWERGLHGQARELSEAFEILSANRIRWRIGGAWWFTWTDEGGSCLFCGSAGLLTEDREAKPAWYRFNAWTGGNADTVPKAKFGN